MYIRFCKMFELMTRIQDVLGHLMFGVRHINVDCNKPITFVFRSQVVKGSAMLKPHKCHYVRILILD